jgi:hypothetical protein
MVLVSCSEKINESDTSNSIVYLSDTSQTSPDTVSNAYSSSEEDDCVFDTSAYKFTTEAIRKINRDYRFIWNDMEKEATVFLEGGDTLILHIGGCVHFSFVATYKTDSVKFYDQSYLLNKTSWIADNFFTHGFDENYTKILKDKKYIPASDNTTFRKYFSVADTTLPENEYYEGFYFELVGNRTEIGISGYIN